MHDEPLEGGTNESNSNHLDYEHLVQKAELEEKHKVGYQDGTNFGGFLTILAVLILFSQTIVRFYQIWSAKERTVSNNEFIIPDDDASRLDLTLSDFDSSLNFIIGF